MSACATYTISLAGPSIDVMDVIELLSEEITDQDCFDDYDLEDRFCDTDDEDEDDYDLTRIHRQEIIEIFETHDCVWLEDIEALARKLVRLMSTVCFSIAGHIEDGEADEYMDFDVRYNGKKLISQSSCWYIYIHMDEYENYTSFCQKFCDKYGNPRYTEEEYRGFCECADEWYVMDGGKGEFTSKVSLNNEVRIKI